MPTLGAIFPPSLPPERLRDVAVAADDAGLEQLWVWEDCFWESGLATAAAALAWTQRITVGVGLLPVPLRNVAITAMELATIERLFPGRFVPGVGHGVLDWMGQVGARAQSPMTLLGEYTSALRALLHGERVSVSGRYVHLSDVELEYPPVTPPPLLVGAVKPKTLALAGEVGDGVIFTGDTTPEMIRDAMPTLLSSRHRAEAPDVVVFVPIADQPSAAEVAARLGKYADAGATHTAVLSVGDDPPPLEEFVAFLGSEVAPLLR